MSVIVLWPPHAVRGGNEATVAFVHAPFFSSPSLSAPTPPSSSKHARNLLRTVVACRREYAAARGLDDADIAWGELATLQGVLADHAPTPPSADGGCRAAFDAAIEQRATDRRWKKRAVVLVSFCVGVVVGRR